MASTTRAAASKRAAGKRIWQFSAVDGELNALKSDFPIIAAITGFKILVHCCRNPPK
jgi:hypothetical protein